MLVNHTIVTKESWNASTSTLGTQKSGLPWWNYRLIPFLINKKLDLFIYSSIGIGLYVDNFKSMPCNFIKPNSFRILFFLITFITSVNLMVDKKKIRYVHFLTFSFSSHLIILQRLRAKMRTYAYVAPQLTATRPHPNSQPRLSSCAMS